jgi:hypothetical protein
MKKIIQDENGKKMIMNVVSSVPSLPEGWSVLGLADDLPEAIAEIEVASQVQVDKAAAKQFLVDTDWKVMRHIRQLALGETPSLTHEEYLALEELRSAAAASI